jgi:rod shape-determining protein MreB
LKVRDARGGRFFDDEPLVGLSDSDPPKIEAVGASAKVLSRCVNPFSHPRVLVSDYIIAERLLLHAFKTVSGKFWLRAAPVAVMHVTEDLEGGLTDMERRVLQELAEGVGARKVYIWEGRELTDEELRSGVHRQSLGATAPGRSYPNGEVARTIPTDCFETLV